MADCPSCGGVLKFDIASQKVKCEYCGSLFEPAQVTSTQSADSRETMGVTEFFCPNCGGQIYSTDRDLTGLCSYCGSQVVFEQRIGVKNRPEKIIPFQKTREECKQIYLEHLKGAKFIPKELKDPQYIDGFRGIYMPYCLTDVKQSGDIRYYASESHTAAGLQADDDYRIEGKLNARYEDLYHDAALTFADDMSERLEPFYPSGRSDASVLPMQPFHPAYLSGFYAEPADAGAEDYSAYFKDEADTLTDEFLRKHPVLQETSVEGVPLLEYDKYDLLKPLDSEEEDQVWKELTDTAEPKSGRRSSRGRRKEERYKLQDARDKEWEREYDELKKSRKNTSAAQEPSGPVNLSNVCGCETVQTSRMALFPVWFISWKKGKRVAYAAVNGQTGQVVADLPIDLKQFFMWFGAVFAVCFLIFLLLTIRPASLAVLSVFFAAITVHMYSCELNMLAEHSGGAVIHKKREGMTLSSTVGIIGTMIVMICAFILQAVVRTDNDMVFATGHIAYCIYSLGALLYAVCLAFSCVAKWRAVPGGDRGIPGFVPAAAAAVLGTVQVFLDPNSDLLSYSITALCFAGIAATVLFMVLQFNRIATRPLPQFDHMAVVLCVLCLWGLSSARAEAAVNEYYVNEETGYEVVFSDQASLIDETASDIDVIYEQMDIVSGYGNAVFLSVDENTESTADLAEEVYRDWYGTESGMIFVIDMANREIYIFCDGDVYDTINRPTALTITDNVYSYASDGDYYECVLKAFTQAADRLEGRRIAQPMRIVSALFLALFASLMITFIAARSGNSSGLQSEGEWRRSFRISKNLDDVRRTLVRRDIHKYESSDGGGSSGGGGGGGSSGGGGGHGF